MLYYKPKHLKSVVPSIFTTEPPSAADSIILDSRILSEEKLNLNSKFALLDQFSHRAFDIKEYNLTQRELPSIKKHVIQNNKLDVWGETTLTLYRNQFLYTSLDIHEKYSPVVLFIYVKKGDPNTKMRLFCSVRFQQPNRFNAEIETYGRVLKYHSSDGTTFYDPTLYVAILAQNDVVITIKNEFAKPPLPRKILQLKKKDEQNQEFEELADLIIRKRKLKQKSLNFINFNRSLLRKQRIESPCNTERLKEIKYKQTSILKEQNLKHIAQIALHDVAKEIKHKQMNIQLKQMHKEWICKKWIQIVILINYIVPSISNYIKVQKRISEKNMRKQILTMQFINKIKHNILLQGPKIKPRTLLLCKMSMQICIHSQQDKVKQKSQHIIIEILRQNIKSYYTVTKGLHTVNLSNQKMHQHACQTQEQEVGIHGLDEDCDIPSMQTDLWGHLEDEVAINLATAPLAIVAAGEEQEQEGSPSLLNS
ncbi:unnamed protein product (macronuclear) [Paramecium tetraurelia]|uniref:Uncharacterized protein n=1 Tax=Paramecium tetraurelia TaxID=5888 RepID=A0BX92_PARTE|nr:uncharacterized protein GSPATT00033012001 [Paramecium tetraurelia]CAK63159.1 unnamed protein product [Paramecium tetraurelia]|eukprot:XP_001430557.1 hypothetical protein (macronuclear) [Paramecium tetraurelia strain d4-2]